MTFQLAFCMTYSKLLAACLQNSLNSAIYLAQNPRDNKEQLLLTVFLYLTTDSIKNLILAQAWAQANQGEPFYWVYDQAQRLR